MVTVPGICWHCGHDTWIQLRCEDPEDPEDPQDDGLCERCLRASPSEWDWRGKDGGLGA